MGFNWFFIRVSGFGMRLWDRESTPSNVACKPRAPAKSPLQGRQQDVYRTEPPSTSLGIRVAPGPLPVPDLSSHLPVPG